MVRAGVDPQAVAGRGGRVVELSEEGGVVLESGFLFSAEFVRVGDDLLLRGDDGREVLVRDYFAQDPPPPLETAEGARLLPETVDGLAIPEAPLAYAQAGTVQLAEPIGQVSTLSGSARVQRPDGTRANLSEGDPIFEGDVVSTGVGSELGILFVDDTVFSLSANARMVINELIYNPSSTANSMGISLIQGTFVFITGKVAPSGGIDVDTPVGTIGIRGTTVGVEITSFGGFTTIANLVNPETGELGSFTFANAAGAALFNLANHFLEVRSATQPPGTPSVASGQDISEAWGRALNTAVQIQSSVQQQNDESDPDPDQTDDQETSVDPENLQALQEDGLTPEQIQEILDAPPIEAEAGPGDATDGGSRPQRSGSTFGRTQRTEAEESGTNSLATLDDVGGGTTTTGGGTTGGTTLEPELPTAVTDDEPTTTTATSNAAPVLLAAVLNVSQGQTLAITPANFNASDSDDATLGLTFNITNLTGGQFELINGPGTPVTSFTLAQVVGGQVVFVDDGDETAPSYDVSVSDGNTATPPVPAAVAFNNPPVAANDSISIDEDDDNGATAAQIEAFFGLAAGALDALANDGDAANGAEVATSGSAIKTLVGVQAGDQVSFTFNFLDSENPDEEPIFKDFAFVVINGQDFRLSNVDDADMSTNATADFGQVFIQFDDETGYLTFQFTFTASGSFEIGFGVMNEGDELVDAGLLIDNLVIVRPNGEGDQIVFQDNFSSLDNWQTLAGAFTTIVEDIGTNESPPGPPTQGLLVSASSFVTTGNVLTDNGNGADSDPDGDPLTVVAVNGSVGAVGSEITLASGALLTLNADGTFSYDPNGAFESLGVEESAEDSFEYTMSDGNEGSDTATVTITVNGVNDPPLAADDGGAGFVTDEDSTFTTASVLNNDSDVEDDPLSVTEVNGQTVSVGQQITLGSGALLTLNADGSFDYDPNGQFESLGGGDYGEDVFEYRVSDGNDGSDTATVTITVNGVNNPPLAADDGGAGFVTDEDNAFTTSSVLDNDSDPDDDPLSVTEVNGQAVSVGQQITLGSGALLTLNADGSFDYDPNSQFESLGGGDYGEDVFEYRVSDGNDGSDTATVTIAVTGVNDDPVVTSDTAGLVKGASLAITTAILSASDAETTDPAQLTFTVTAEVAGEILLSEAPAASFTLADVIAGLVTFQHDGSDGAAAGFTVTASDPDGGASLPADLSFAVAASFVWTNEGGDGDWNNPLNWASESVPIDGADVVIPGQPGAVIFSSGSAVLQSLTLEGGSLVITGGSFAVTGDLTSEIGSTIAVSGGSFEVAGGTLDGTFAWTGGTVTGDGAPLTINGPANLGGIDPVTLDIALDLNGLGALTGSIQGGGAIANGGNLLVASATTLGIGFSNEADGSLAVSSNLTIDNGSGFRNSGSITIAAFATLAVIGGDFENAFGAEIGGDGTIDVTGGSLINNGTINPGASPGTFTVLGDYEQGPDGLLTVEIDGTGGDLLQVSGTASFAGVIDVVFLNGFIPTAGDTLNFVQAEEIIDNGVEVTGLEYAGGLLGVQLAGGVASFVAITGGGDTFVDPFEIIVGDAAFGSLTVDAGQDLASQYFSVGEQVTGIGEFVLTNASTLTIEGPSFIGKAGIGDATISGGASAEFISTDFDNLVIASLPGSSGSLLIDGDGTTVTTKGTDNTVQVGLAGTGDMTVQGGASLSTLQLEAGRNGQGTITIQGDGTLVTASNDEGIFSGEFAENAGFVRAGRNAGSDGTIEVLDGARLEIRNGQGVNDDTRQPGLQIAREDGSTGGVLIDGAGSLVDISQTAPTDPDNDIFGPFVQVGRGGSGSLEVRNGGQLNLTGGHASFAAGREASGDGTVLVDGPGSAVTLTGEDLFVSIGREGNGQLTLSNAAAFKLAGGEDFVQMEVGRESGVTGTVLVQSGASLSLQGGDGNTRLRIGRFEDSEGTVTVTGEGSELRVGGTNADGSFNNRIEVGKWGTGALNTLDGASVVTERLDLGFNETGVGTGLVDNASWEIGDGHLWVGREGNGTLTIQNSGQVTAGAGFNTIADAGGSTGVVNVDATSSFNVNGFFSVGNGFFEPDLFPDFGQDATATGRLNVNGGTVVTGEASVGTEELGVGIVVVDGGSWTTSDRIEIGDEGDGTLTIQNGGTVVVGDGVDDGATNIADISGSMGVVNVDATSSFTVNGYLIVGGGFLDAIEFPEVGQAEIGEGRLNINGGSASSRGAEIGEQLLGVGIVTVDSGTWQNAGELNVGVQGDGTLDIRNGGSVNVAGDHNSIANAGGSAGSVSIDVESSLTVNGKLTVGLGWFDPADDPTFGQSTTATGSLAVNGGTLATQGVDIGGQRLGIGEVTVDGGTWTDTGGSENGFAVGQAGDGTLVLRNGASVTTNGGFNSIANAGGSRGNVTVDATSSLTYEGYLSVGNGFYDPIEFPGFGRDAEATGILTIEGGTVTAQNADIGGTERGRGFVTIDGDGALFDAGGSLNIGHLGEGTVTLKDGGELRADTVSVGADGSLGGVGLVDGDVFINGGTVDPGLSPGELEVDGSFTLNDGLLLFEIAGTTPGTGHDVLTVSSPNPGSGNVNLNGGVIQFDFDPDFTPLVSDRFAFLNYVSLSESDDVAYRFTGVDPTNFVYGFFDDVPGTRSLGFFGNSVSLGNGVVFEGGEGDDYEAGSAFADRIDGAEGSDTLGGAGGNDTLTGGDYGDTFVFTLAPLDAGAPGAELTITDFFRGEDVIEIVGWNSTSPHDIGVTGTAYGTMLDFGDGYSIHLDFVYGYVLNPDDFVFRVLASGDVSRPVTEFDDVFVGSALESGRLEVRDGAEFSAQGIVAGDASGAFGEVLVTDTGSLLRAAGEDAIIDLGNDGTGEMTVSGGAKIESLWVSVARNGSGSMIVTGDGTEIELSNDFGVFESRSEDSGGFFRVGRNAGSEASLSVLAGAVINIEASPGFNTPQLQIAREHESQGTVLVDGEGSQINITQTDSADPENDIFGPNLNLHAGDADMTIQNGGAVTLFGSDAFVTVSRGNASEFANPDDAPVLAQSSLQILSGGTLTVDGDDFFAGLQIGREANGDGSVLVRGEGSELILRGLSPNIFVGHDGVGELHVDQGGFISATFLTIGGEAGSRGTATVDGSADGAQRTEVRLSGRDEVHQGAFVQVGKGGEGSLTVKGGALLSIDGDGGQFPGFNVGREAGSMGTMVVDGIGTQVLIANGDGGPAGSLGFIAVGREGTGTLDVTQGAQVVNAAGGVTFVGREAVANGALTVDGIDGTATLFDAGAALVVGADFDFDNGEVLFDSGGTGSVTVADGGTVRAGAAQGDGITDIFIGSGGTVTVQAGGTLIGDIENVGGTLINGNSPGTAAFGGDFAMSDGVLEVELGGTEAGAFDLYQIAGAADFTGGVIEFSMVDGYDPLASDSFVFLTAGALTLDEDALSFVVRGVDQAFDFVLEVGADSLGLTVLNDAGSGESLVFLGGEGDEAFAGGVGDDRLDGGGGRDSLTGGAGSDIFVLRAADGAESLDLADVIADFEIGSDSLGLAEGLGAEDLTITATQGGDAAVALQSSGAILAVLQGVSAADIDPAEITTVV